MISLQRVREAKAIPVRFRGKGKLNKEMVLLKERRGHLLDPTKKQEFDSGYWKESKKQLIAESNGKCAYCEANTKIVAHGDVEHYRPKSVYWWLAYTYDNYLYACQICNQSYKGDNFPLADPNKGMPGPVVEAHFGDTELKALLGKISPDPMDPGAVAQLEAAHRAENALLVNPYVDNPADYIAYEADENLKSVRIVPASPAYAPYVKAMEEYYGINRPELLNARYEVYQTFRLFTLGLKVKLPQDLKREYKQQVVDMLSDGYLFAGMNRFFHGKI